MTFLIPVDQQIMLPNGYGVSPYLRYLLLLTILRGYSYRRGSRTAGCFARQADRDLRATCDDTKGQLFLNSCINLKIKYIIVNVCDMRPQYSEHARHGPDRRRTRNCLRQ